MRKATSARGRASANGRRRTRTTETIDEYLSRLEPEQRRLLEELRRTVKRSAPDAEELISYGMPAFRQNGMLVYFGAFKDHCSLFTGGSVRIRRLYSKELKPFESGRGTLRFSPSHPIPADLVARIIKTRVAENQARRAK